MYGAKAVTFTPAAQEKLKTYTRQGYANLPICMAKTPLSLTTDPSIKGVPTDFTVTSSHGTVHCCSL